MLTQLTKQRETAGRLQEFWNAYMSAPICVEQCMTWLDRYSESVIEYGIKEAARKQAKMRGQMTLDALTAYATRTMRHEDERRKQGDTGVILGSSALASRYVITPEVMKKAREAGLNFKDYSQALAFLEENAARRGQ